MERIPFQFRAVSIPFLIAVVLVLSACSLIDRGDDEGAETAAGTVLGNQATLMVGPATLMCTQECSDRGFCGTLPDGGQAILMSAAGPTAQRFNFDVFALDNTAVTIMDLRPEDAVLRSNPQTTLTINYYAITSAEIPQAWVAGWCIGQPPPQ